MRSYIVKIFTFLVVILVVFLSYNYIADNDTLSNNKDYLSNQTKNNEKALAEYKVDIDKSTQLNEKMNKVNKLLNSTDKKLQSFQKNASINNEKSKQSNKQEIAILKDELSRVKKAIKKMNTEFN